MVTFEAAFLLSAVRTCPVICACLVFDIGMTLPALSDCHVVNKRRSASQNSLDDDIYLKFVKPDKYRN